MTVILKNKWFHCIWSIAKDQSSSAIVLTYTSRTKNKNCICTASLRVSECMFDFIQSGRHIICVNSDLSVVLCYQNMLFDIKFTRFEDAPWGFRLTGGSDFDVPLTVVKVSKIHIFWNILCLFVKSLCAEEKPLCNEQFGLTFLEINVYMWVKRVFTAKYQNNEIIISHS